ncbi:MAG TPA: hypothetical protein VD794_14365 [Flavisolibacter sp.]|nr:hypothetical protein [Flavisolibacter sp.]
MTLPYEILTDKSVLIGIEIPIAIVVYKVIYTLSILQNLDFNKRISGYKPAIKRTQKQLKRYTTAIYAIE